MLQKLFRNISQTRLIALSFVLVILTGTLLLCLPIASRQGEWTNFIDALFTATSATCVTGLIVFDTYTHWSLFGQLVILLMIQIGGIGLMSIITMFFIFMKKKIGLHERMLLMQSAGTMRVSGVIRLIKKIFLGTLIIEGIGAILLAFRFIPMLGIVKGIYYSIFHSISAFCNAGFDLMGYFEPFSSLTGFQTDWYFNIIIMLLIMIGGIGFLVWMDIVKFKFSFSKFQLHSKIVLITTAILLVTGFLGFLFLEQQHTLKGMSPGNQILSSLFMSVTTRTAGYNTIDLNALSPSSSLLSVILMAIGGSPGSTAGGIKTSTVALIFLTMASLTKGDNDVTFFKKRLENRLIKQAAIIIMVYGTGILLSTILICHIEQASMTNVLFETSSAIGTVGLTQGLTPTLSLFSRLLLIVMMFGGRIGAVSLLLVFREHEKSAPTSRPTEKILIG